MLFRLIPAALILIHPWASGDAPFAPGQRSMVCAHNAYPEHGEFYDRLERALSAGKPISIEQDVAWFVDPDTGEGRSIVTHGPPLTGDEPTLAEYFFEGVRPIVEEALEAGPGEDWPIITLNIEFKDGSVQSRRGVRAVLEEYADWLSTAERVEDPADVQPIQVAPILALTQGGDQVFHDEIPLGGRLLVFGSARTQRVPMPEGLSRREQADWSSTVAPADMLSERASNYRRWWNNSWRVIESRPGRDGAEVGAQTRARLEAFARHAHQKGYWLRLYAVNGYDRTPRLGWSPLYNAGSLEAAQHRWRAARDAGVDFIATDQYEAAADALRD